MEVFVRVYMCGNKEGEVEVCVYVEGRRDERGYYSDYLGHI